MKYILDKNVLTIELLNNRLGRKDLCITEDVLDEFSYSSTEIEKIKKAGIQVLKLSKKHLEKLKEILDVHGKNLKLINLSTDKGTADVTMLAYALAERDDREKLFGEQYTIVTQDVPLTIAAGSYQIDCIPQIPKTS